MKHFLKCLYIGLAALLISATSQAEVVVVEGPGGLSYAHAASFSSTSTFSTWCRSFTANYAVPGTYSFAYFVNGVETGSMGTQFLATGTNRLHTLYVSFEYHAPINMDGN